MTIRKQIHKMLDDELLKELAHTEDCLDANDDTSVFKGKCICPKTIRTEADAIEFLSSHFGARS